jgi:hypothetical protein
MKRGTIELDEFRFIERLDGMRQSLGHGKALPSPTKTAILAFCDKRRTGAVPASELARRNRRRAEQIASRVGPLGVAAAPSVP